MKEISVIILTHNATKYVKETLETLNEVTEPEYRDKIEIIVWDNASQSETLDLLHDLSERGYIDKIFYSKENLFFAGGNNRASKLASNETKYYLLLNSDIRINDPQWLRILMNAKKEGSYAVASFGACENPPRADGYCFMIDKSLYNKYMLDETFQWWWGITKLQAHILQENKNILGFQNHNSLLFHYGGKSGNDFYKAKGINTDINEILSWFISSKGRFYKKRVALLGKYFSLIKKYRK